MKNKSQKELSLSSSKGFTLVELLVVIAIIGILATLLLLQLGVARQRARDAKRIVDISQVRTAVELYFDDFGNYPQVATWSALDAIFVPKYMTQLTQDPLSTGTYAYNYAYSGQTKYHVWAELEQKAAALNGDADIDSGVGGWTGQTILGSAETCVNATTIDCVYDQGQSQ